MEADASAVEPHGGVGLTDHGGDSAGKQINEPGLEEDPWGNELASGVVGVGMGLASGAASVADAVADAVVDEIGAYAFEEAIQMPSDQGSAAETSRSEERRVGKERRSRGPPDH